MPTTPTANRIIHPDTVRRLVRNSLQSLTSDFSRNGYTLTALTLHPAVDPQGSLQWHGQFIGASPTGMAFGAYTFREHGNVPQDEGMHLSNIIHQPHGRDQYGGFHADADRIETRLRSEAIWWVPSDPFGPARPCGMMARRIQHISNRIIARATN